MSKRFFLTLIKTFRFVVKCAYLPYFPTNSLRVIAYSWSVNRQRFLLSTPMETSKLNKNEVNNYLDAQTCHFMSGKGHYCLTCALRPRLFFSWDSFHPLLLNLYRYLLHSESLTRLESHIGPGCPIFS